jgi:hypothetical protein
MATEMDTAAEEALLMELAQLGMGVARRLHEVLLNTTDPDRLVALAAAYHQVGRGVRQSLALRARFAAGTVAILPATRAEAAPRAPAQPPEPELERPDWNERERPDWIVRLKGLGPADGEPLDLELADGDLDACRERIRHDLTAVSRSPALSAIPALQPSARVLAGRAALLGCASLRLVNSS